TTLSNLANVNFKFTTGSVSHNLVTGIEWAREESDALRFGTNNLPAISILRPNPDRAQGSPSNPSESNDVRVDTQAIYVYDTMEFTEHWQLTGGLRAEHYEVSID